MRYSQSSYFIILALSLLAGFKLSLVANDQKQTPPTERGFLASIVDTTISCLHYMTCPMCLINPDRQEQKFYEALESNNSEAIEHLVYRRSHDPNQPVKNDLPLVIAAKKGHIESVEKLINLEANVNLQPHANYPTALIAVCAAEHLDPECVKNIVHLLLQRNADPTLSCRHWTDSEFKIIEKTQEAIAQKNQVLAEELMRYLPQNCFNQRTALDFAKINRYDEALKLIRRALSTYVKQDPETHTPNSKESSQDEEDI